MTPWWQKLFDSSYLKVYDYTQHSTDTEVAFLDEVLDTPSIALHHGQPLAGFAVVGHFAPPGVGGTLFRRGGPGQYGGADQQSGGDDRNSLDTARSHVTHEIHRASPVEAPRCPESIGNPPGDRLVVPTLLVMWSATYCK